MNGKRFLNDAEVAQFRAAIQAAIDKRGSYRESVLSEVVAKATKTAVPRITAKELRIFREYWDSHV